MQNNQYNLYIDLDEEITIVVGRVRAARASQITLIVPQHAALLQSIINLRLLAREAKKQNKSLIIVTQDEEGADFAERAGIPVAPLQEWQESHATDDTQFEQQGYGEQQPVYAEQFGDVPDQQIGDHNMHIQNPVTQPSLDGMRTEMAREPLRESAHQQEDLLASQQHSGPTDFTQTQQGFQERTAPMRSMDMGMAAPQENTATKSGQSLKESFEQSLDLNPTDGTQEQSHVYADTVEDGFMENSVSPTEVNDYNLHQQQAEPSVTNDYGSGYTHGNGQQLQTDAQHMQFDGGDAEHYPQSPSHQEEMNSLVSEEHGRQIQPNRIGQRHSMEAPQTHKKMSPLTRLFLHIKRAFNREEHDSVLGLEKKKSFSFFRGTSLIVGILICLFIIGFLILPFSRIELETIDLSGQQDISITVESGDRDVDSERRIIGGRIIEKDISFTVKTPATGASTNEAQRAQGTIRIINKNSTSPQPLVATTRFLAEDGTLFRLVQATTVPGFTQKENGDIIPGEIEALVAADEAGEGGNIAPTTFTIPGFGENSDKIKEITGASSIAMVGGSETRSDKKTVTAEDLAKAKEDAEGKREAFVENEIESLLRPDAEVFISDTLEESILRSESNTVEGSAVDFVEYTIVTQVRAFVFSHTDAEKVGKKALIGQQPQLDQESTSYRIEYKSAKPDYDRKKTTVQYTMIAEVPQTINEEQFTEDIANKGHDELKDLISVKYPTISNIFITSYPSFPTFLSQKISPVESFISITVK